MGPAVGMGRAASGAALGAVLLTAAAMAHAQGQDPAQGEKDTAVSATLRLDYFSSSPDLDRGNDVLGAHVELKLSHRLSSSHRLELEARLSREQSNRDGRNRVQLLNGYWLARNGPLDLRVGQQKIRWGKADGINPTDFFTPIDYTVLLPLEADRYLSVPAVRADVQVNDANTVSFVVEPDFTPSRLPWPRLSRVLVAAERPSGWDRPQLGMRLMHTAEALDWSVSAFRGFSTLPVLTFAGLTPTRAPRYLRYYPASEGLGADVARTYGQWGFRAELAYSRYDIPRGRQGVASNYFLVAGFDRAIADWNLNVQALVRYTPRFLRTNTAVTEDQLFSAAQNAIVYNQQYRIAQGMTVRIGTNRLHDTLQGELRVVYMFEPANYLLRPLVTYALSDSSKLIVGGEYYSGPPLSYFGALEANRTVFVEFQQSF
jgi:hypothetical protein